MANILLIYPAPGEFKKRRFGFSLNLLYISSILKQSGHNILGYLDYSLMEFDKIRFINRLNNADFIIIEVDSFTLRRSVNIDHARQLLDLIKENSGQIGDLQKKIILVGDDTSLFPGDYPDADYILPGVIGHNISKVIDSFISGQKVPELTPIENLDTLPFPDRSLLSPFIERGGAVGIKPKLEKSTLLRTSMGCLNSCSFCQRKGWNRTYHTHSIPYVVSEFKVLHNNHYRNIWVVDDNFTFDLNRAKSILKELVKDNVTKNMKIALSS
jgi:radical SAM superfamily enzyme YgiQ (UPF0313 family)